MGGIFALSLGAASLASTAPAGAAGAGITLGDTAASLKSSAFTTGLSSVEDPKSDAGFTTFSESTAASASTANGSATTHSTQDTSLSMNGGQLSAIQSQAASDTAYTQDPPANQSGGRGQSELQVHFTVDSPVDFSLAGSMSASGDFDDTNNLSCTRVQVALLGPGSPANFTVASPPEDTANCSAPGTPEQRSFNTSGTLDPGSYTMYASTDEVAVSHQMTSGSPSGDYDFLLTLSDSGPAGDSDGDGLLNSWETDGVDIDADGQPDLDLPSMGADPLHKDIFLEVDFMPGHRIHQGPIDAVTQAFAQAPVTNPDGHAGIALHVDNGPGSVMNPTSGATWAGSSDQESLAHQNVLGSDFIDNGVRTYDWSQFESLRQTHFAAARRPVFHYVIAAHSGPNQRFSGISRALPASDLIIATHESCDPTPLAQECTPDPEYLAATFMHELGHNLGLQHGGTDEEAHKPNYLSVMNYNFSSGLVLFDGSFELDYSRYNLPLDENALDEQHGFGIDSGPLTAFQTIYRCPGAGGAEKTIPLTTHTVNWNCNNQIQPGAIAADVSANGQVTALTGPTDWDRLVYDGGAVGDLNEPPAPDATVIDEPSPTELRANRALLEAAAAEPPTTKIRKLTVKGKNAKIRFSGNDNDLFGLHFKCRLDRAKFRSCKSPKRYRHLDKGRHKVRVEAIDRAGNVDTSPARKRFRV